MGTSLVNQSHDEILVPSCVYVHLGPTATQEVNASNDSISNSFFILIT